MNIHSLKIQDAYNSDNCVEEIMHLYEEICQHDENIMQKAIRIGEILIHRKQNLPHGQFTPWIEKELPFCVRTGQLYMDIFRNRDLLKSEKISHFSEAQSFLRSYRSNFKESKGDNKEKRYFKTFSLYQEEKEMLEDSLNKAKKMLKTHSDSKAISHIAYEWFMAFT